MTLAKRIQELYRKVMTRVHAYLLPLILFLSYLSALILKEGSFKGYFSRIEVSTIHGLSGFLLMAVLMLFIYDWLYYYFLPQERARILIKPRELLKLAKNQPISQQVDRWFYLILGVLALTGLCSYLSLKQGFNLFLSIPAWLYWHEILAWGFLFLLILKYYFTLTLWFGYLLQTLKRG